MHFKQETIVHKVKEIADGNVDAVKVFWWINADNEKAYQLDLWKVNNWRD